MRKETAKPEQASAYDAQWVEGLLLAPDRVRRFPRASRYDPRWLWENEAGSHSLWLAEALCEKMDLQPGQRVLNLGCANAVESIFLAREFGVQVWAVDLGVDPSENWRRIVAAGVGERVFPLRGDAVDLPFADAFFDAIISLNTLQFVGTDDLFLTWRLLPRLRPGGQIGVVVPGLRHEFEAGPPDHLRPYWSPDLLSWHSPDWWRRHWEKTSLVTIDTADNFADGEGFDLFYTWARVMRREQGLLSADGGRTISFVRLVARKPAAQ
ncbi:MAG TPA: methyltransferase domain-containing protein [Anaerolineaceae bacterium]|nr:methyltransferase domain-containing protein [Anaerolineaceae bacterium]